MAELNKDVIIHTLNTGEKVTLATGQTSKEGDEVIVFPQKDGSFITQGVATIEEGDEVIVLKTRNGEDVAIKTGTSKICIKICNAQNREVYPPGSTSGDSMDLGTFNFKWDGEGRVYILSSCKSEVIELGYADDMLEVYYGPNLQYITVSTIYGTMVPTPHVAPGPPLELTNILNIGENTIKVLIRDMHGSHIGTGYDLYIVQKDD